MPVIIDCLKTKQEDKDYTGKTMLEFILFVPLTLFPVYSILISIMLPLMALSFIIRDYILESTPTQTSILYFIILTVVVLVTMKLLTYVNDRVIVKIFSRLSN
jgi:ABC-type protease/lipase transport system fused ATPase/permease subunit